MDNKFVQYLLRLVEVDELEGHGLETLNGVCKVFGFNTYKHCNEVGCYVRRIVYLAIACLFILLFY
jgi:hypothetical protein